VAVHESLFSKAQPTHTSDARLRSYAPFPTLLESLQLPGSCMALDFRVAAELTGQALGCHVSHGLNCDHGVDACGCGED